MVFVRRRVRTHGLAVAPGPPHPERATGSVLLRRRGRTRQRRGNGSVVTRPRTRVVALVVRLVGRRLVVRQRRDRGDRVPRGRTAVCVGRQRRGGVVAVHGHVRVRRRIRGVDGGGGASTVPVGGRGVQERGQTTRMARGGAVGGKGPALLGVWVLRGRHLRVVVVARVGAHRAELGGGGFISGRDGLEIVRLVEDAVVL